MKLVGNTFPVQNHYIGSVVPNTSTPSPYDYYTSLDTQKFNAFVDSFNGMTKTTTNIRNENYNYFADCNANALIQQHPIGDEIAGAGVLNNPSSIIPSQDENILVIANTGLSNIATFNISSREVTYIAGNGTANDTDDNLLAVDAGIANPRGLAYDNNGNLFVSTALGHIRKISSDGTITTVAGNALNGLYVAETEPLKMKLSNPYGLAYDALSNSLFVADSGYNRIVKIDFNSNLATTVAGTNEGVSSEESNNPLKVSLLNPTHLKIDQDRNLIIVDSGNKKIRKMNLDKLSGAGDRKYLASSNDHSQLIKKTDGTFVRKYRDGRTEVFDVQGKNTQSIAANGMTVDFQYNAQNHLSKVIFPNQQEINYNYTNNKLRTIVDMKGRVTEFNHNGLNQLTSVSYSDGTDKLFEYTGEGLLSKETSQNGLFKNFEYNQFDRLEKVTDSMGSKIEIKDSGSKNLAHKDTQGNGIPLNSGTNSEFMIDPNGNSVSFSKDLDGFVSKIIDAEGRTKTVKRDSEGKILEIVDVDGTIIQNKYDSTFGDLIEAKNVSLNITSKKSYNANGLVVKETDPYGKIFKKTYNEKLQLVSQIQPDDKYSEISYNPLGLISEKSHFNSAGVLQSKTIYDYNSLGQLIRQTNLDGKYTSYTYDLAGNVLTSTVNINVNESATTNFYYDDMNRVIKVVSPKNEITEYKYSHTGDLIEIKDPKLQITSFEYDDKGKMIKKTDPTGAINSMTYDANGNMLTEVDPANQTKVYSYNAVNKITKIQTADDIIEYNYNIKDEVISISNYNSNIVYTRDEKQRILSETVSGTGTGLTYPSHSIAYAYSQNDLRTQMNSTYQNVTYSYNPNNYNMTGVHNSFGEIFGFAYDEANRLSSITRPGSKTEFGFDVGSSLTSIIHSANNVVKSSFEYQYDLRNYITQKRSAASTVNYSYDSNGQLTSLLKVENIDDNEVFAYDSLGNRITHNGVSSTFDITGQRIQDDSKYTYLFDLNGNILAKNSKTNGQSYRYEYTALNQIKFVSIFENSISVIPLKKIGYVYDPIGRRISKSLVDYSDSSLNYTKKFYYDDTNIIAEIDAENNLLATYTYRPEIHDDILSARFTNFSVSSSNGGAAIAGGYILSDRIGSVYYAKDHLNSVTEILDGNGSIIQKYDYSAYGVISSIKNSLNQNVGFFEAPIRTTFTFTGREYEPETKTYNFRARQYDPSNGRFFQQDTDPGKIKSPRSFLTKYAYVQNVPTMFNDPTGKSGEASMRNYFPNPSYAHGEWCGYAAVGANEPIDGLDNACRLHDMAYGYGLNTSGRLTYYNFFNPDSGFVDARIRTDLNLISEGLKLAFTQDGSYFFDGILTAAFGLWNLSIELFLITPISNLFRALGL